MRCMFCNGVSIQKMPMSEVFKCFDCGVELVPQHPDPLMLVARMLREDLAERANPRKIRAIQWYRRFTGAGLRESKQVIDSLLETLQLDRSLRS